MDFDFDDMAYPDIFLFPARSLKEAGTQEKIR